MNSVVVEEEWPPHRKLAPSNENAVTTQAFVQCTEALFLRKNRHFYHIFNFNANFEANFFP